MTLLPKQNRIRDKKHRKWIASLPCCVSGRTETQAAHIRDQCFSAGMKPGDDLCIPLDYKEHALQHKIGEKLYWQPHGGIDKAKQLAKDLYAIRGDTDKAMMLIVRFKNGNI